MEIQASLPQNTWDFSEARGIISLVRNQDLGPNNILSRNRVFAKDVDGYSHSYFLPSSGTRKNSREEQWPREVYTRLREFQNK